MLDPQCYIDGAPPVPEFAARFGVRVLRSWPLRALANKIAYKDKSLGTDDAIRVGLLHCERDGWEDDAVAWLLGGGYSVSDLVRPALLDKDTLILWGDSDEILPPKDNVPQFLSELPDATLRVVVDNGHVPHLEQPKVTADALERFVRGDPVAGGDGVVPGTFDARAAPLESVNIIQAGEVISSATGPPTPGSKYDWNNISKEPLGKRKASARLATARRRPSETDADVLEVKWNAPITIAGLLFFLPLYFTDTFFAISRSFICNPNDFGQVPDLCRPPADFAA